MKVVDVMEPSSSLEPCSQVVEAKRKVRETVYSTCSFQNDDFGEVADENGIERGKYLLEPVDLMLNERPNNVLSGRGNVNSHYDSQFLRAWRKR